MSEAAAVGASSRDIRWNFAAAVVDAAGWGLGMGLISHTTILPLFVGQITPEPLAVGLIPALMYFGWYLPGILVSRWVDSLPRVRASVMWIALIERLALLAIAAACPLFGIRRPELLLMIFFGSWAVMNIAMGANTPGYFKLIAKTIPASMRGRLYGLGGAISGLLGMVTGQYAAWLLDRFSFPTGYAICFLAAFVVQTLSVLPLGFMREPVQEKLPDSPPPTTNLPRPRRIGFDPRLSRLCLASALISVNGITAAFLTLYALQHFRVTDAAAAQFTIAVMGCRTLGSILVGWIGDRYGNRAALLVSTVCGCAGAVTALAAPSAVWLYPAFGLAEIAAQGWGICTINYVLELCGPEKSATYTAQYSLLVGPARVGGPLLGALLVSRFGYRGAFATALLAGITVLVLLLVSVPEPRNVSHESKRAASDPT